MEKLFDNTSLRELATAPPVHDGERVRLRRQHLLVDRALAEAVFPGERQVYAVYYPQRGALLLAPMTDEAFKALHECSLLMLKDRNLQGDKSISLQELIIDHDLDASDRALTFSTRPGLCLLQVILHPSAQP